MSHTRVTARWTGIPGAPGYTGLNFSGALDAVEALAAANLVREFFEDIKAFLPSDARITYDAVARIFDGSGQLENEVSFVAPTPTQGAGTGIYSAPSGAVITWLTNVYRNGRRFRGRTYIVPLNGNAYQDDGSLSNLALSTITDAAIALSSDVPQLAVFGGDDVRGYATAPVSAVMVPDKAAVLRSRRD